MHLDEDAVMSTVQSEPMNPVRLLLVDDQDLIRESLHIVLDMDPEINVVGLAENGHAAIKQCEEHQPDVVLMDIHMPVMDGLEATRTIRVARQRGRLRAAKGIASRVERVNETMTMPSWPSLT